MKNLITLSAIQKEYLQPIKRNFKTDIEKYINSSVAQKYILKALKGKLTDKDVKDIYSIGKKSGQMPNLYWLCTIYIHPLTTTAFIFKKIA